MELAGSMFGLSFRKTPRKGQEEVFNAVAERRRGSLNIQEPTGYGKTFTAAATYSILKKMGEVDRMLYVVPTTPQLNQFICDGAEDLKDADVSGSNVIFNAGYSAALAIKQHRLNKSQVFVCTVQTLTNPRSSTWEAVTSMMSSSRWMLVIDEYHHYAIDATWGKRALQLPCVFRLAMSATPYRKDQDSAFGPPDITVSYRQAVSERAVKKLICHSYVYRIDAILANGDLRSFTTGDLIQEVGSDDPNAIDKVVIERKMRWSPKYISPLVDRPVARMVRARLKTGLPHQVLIGAMSCSHAHLVHEQVSSMYPELNVDWVGTGDFGRPLDENGKIIRRFCPKKVNGVRRAQDISLDVLIHVAMAGEGLDSMFVSEIVHLNPANINNQNNQENGRAARFIPNCEHEQIGYINVDSSSPYAEFTGERIMDVIDDPLAIPGDEQPQDSSADDGDFILEPIPSEMQIRIDNIEIDHVDEGEVQRMATVLAELVPAWGPDALRDPDHEIHRAAETEYRLLRRKEAEQFNEASILQQHRDQVNRAVSSMAGKMLRITLDGERFEKSLPGDFKKRINAQKVRIFGSIDGSDVDSLKRQYEWLVQLDQKIICREIPEWLK